MEQPKWPQHQSEQALLHSLMDDVNAHYRELPTGELQPITPQGMFHIEELHLNRPQLVAKRLAATRLEYERRESERILRDRDELEAQVTELMRELFGE